MEEVTLYCVTATKELHIQADDSEDAINKAKEWIEDNAGKLDYTWTTKTALIEEEEE